MDALLLLAACCERNILAPRAALDGGVELLSIGVNLGKESKKKKVFIFLSARTIKVQSIFFNFPTPLSLSHSLHFTPQLSLQLSYPGPPCLLARFPGDLSRSFD